MKRLVAWDVAYAIDMAIACWLSYAVAVWILAPFTRLDDDLLSGRRLQRFSFRDSRVPSWMAGLERLLATTISFALCLPWLLFLPATPLALSLLIGAGSLVMMLLNRQDDVVTTGITTAVVLGVAMISPEHAWEQPVLRFIDTFVGITIGICCKWVASYAFYRIKGGMIR
jgi:putative flippase GtrA